MRQLNGQKISTYMLRALYHLRSIKLCSQEHELLISFVLSFVYTKPEELGWDPTITRQWIQGHTCYDITVDAFEGKGTVPTVFRTELILSDFAADALRGRARDSNVTIGSSDCVHHSWID